MTDREVPVDGLPVLSEHADKDTTVTVIPISDSECTMAKHMTDSMIDDTTEVGEMTDNNETTTDNMAGIDNRATFLETYFEYMQRRWNGALTYGSLDPEKKWKTLTNENGYLLEMRTFAGFRDLVYLTDELKAALRELAQQEVGVEIKIGTEEFRYRVE